MKIKKRILCPICKEQGLQPYAGFEAGMNYQCSSCGYIGPLYIEEHFDEED